MNQASSQNQPGNQAEPTPERGPSSVPAEPAEPTQSGQPATPPSAKQPPAPQAKPETSPPPAAPTQPVAQPQPAKPKLPTSTAYLAIVALIALLLGGGIWSYLHWKVNPQLTTKPIALNVGTRAGAEEEKSTEQTQSQWKTYSNPDANFTFEYGNGWEVKEDYVYETAAGESSGLRTIILCPIEINDYNTNELRCNSCITFNMRQESCADFNSALKYETIGPNQVCCSGGKNPGREEVLNRIKETFKEK